MISELLEAQGRWKIRLRADAPFDDLDRWGHVIVTPEWVDPRVFADADLLALSRYTGILWHRRSAGDGYEISGPSLVAHLGDHEGKGDVFETEISSDGDSFAQAVRKRLPPGGAITEGTLHSVVGTYDGDDIYVTPRGAIDYVCGVFEAEWRVNPDGTLDAGLEADLYSADPGALARPPVLVNRGGSDPNAKGIPVAALVTEDDVADYTTKVLLLGQGEGAGDALLVGTATAASVPYKDIHGNALVRKRIVNEAETSEGNASARAQLHLNRFSSERQALAISTADYDIEGDFALGDTVFVYDPAQGLSDPANEVAFRGELLDPVAIRVVGIEWPVTRGMGVFYRDADGVYTDLTEHVEWEDGPTLLIVGAKPRRLTPAVEGQIISGRVNTTPEGNDTLAPDVPAHINTPWGTQSYQDAEGRTRARIFAEWATPLNTDGSTVTDGSYYEIRWRRQSETAYQYSAVAWGTNQYIIQDLSSGVVYEISVQAVDLRGNASGYGADETVTASEDAIAPSQPAASVVAGNALYIQVSHQLGQALGGTFNLEADLDHLNVYADIVTGFTPADANFLGQIPATSAHLRLGITVIETFEMPDTTQRFVVVTAVDKAGNESAPSPEATVTATLIDTQHITNLAVTTAKIAGLSVTEAKIADLAVATAKIQDAAISTAKIGNLQVTSAKISDAAVTTAKIANAAIQTAKIGNLQVTNAKIADGAISTAKIGNAQITNAKIANLAVTNAKINDLSADKIDAGTLTGRVVRTASSGKRTELRVGGTPGNAIAWYDSGGALVGYIEAGSGQLFATGNGRPVEWQAFTGSGVAAFRIQGSAATTPFRFLFVENADTGFAGDSVIFAQTRTPTTAYFHQKWYSGQIGATGETVASVRGDGQFFSDRGFTTPAADYAEMFETVDGGEIEPGYAVTLDGEFVRVAEQGDVPIGVVSANPTLVGGTDPGYWPKKYLRDRFGAYLTEDVEDVFTPPPSIELDEKGRHAVRERVPLVRQIDRRIINPEFDPNLEYVPRVDRPEWVVVGLLGRVSARDDGTCSPGGYAAPTDAGILGNSEKGWRVLRRIDSKTVEVLIR